VPVGSAKGATEEKSLPRAATLLAVSYIGWTASAAPAAGGFAIAAAAAAAAAATMAARERERVMRRGRGSGRCGFNGFCAGMAGGYPPVGDRFDC
jgi:hypothetical protein